LEIELKEVKKEKDDLQESYEGLQKERNLLVQKIGDLKNDWEIEKERLLKRNQDIQDLLASNPKTRPLMIEMALEEVKSAFSEISELYKGQAENEDKVDELTTQITQLEENSQTIEHEAELKFSQLQLEHKGLKESLESEFKMKLGRELEESVKAISKERDDLLVQLNLSKQKLTERRIDEEKFNQMNLRLKEKDNVISEKMNINQTMKAQIKLKESEIEEMRTAIGYFQSALEESRVREMNNKMR
jgi:chromosome segregation ATPase